VFANHRPVHLVLAVLAGLVVVAAPSAPAHAKEKRRITMLVGEQSVISADGVDKYSAGRPGVVDIRLDSSGKQFVIVALSPGSTTILFLMKDGGEVEYAVQVSADEVRERDNIRLDFYFVQVSRTDGYQVGLAWPGSIAATGTLQWDHDFIGDTNAVTASVTSSVVPRLDLAQSQGWAKIQRRATVVTANGERGLYRSGNEINFRIANAQTTGIEKITFGSDITVQPNFDQRTGRLDLTIIAEVSEPGESGPDAIPNRTFAHLETFVNLEPGQSVLLAGLEAQAEQYGSSGLPLLSKIPVLGYLFGSHSASSNASENLVFIVPTIMTAVDYDSRERIDDAHRMLRSFEGDVDGSLYFEVGGRPRRLSGGKN
jgi:Flp pilus assembly secretin CpaC